MDAIMRIIVIWAIWLALVLWWLTPELNHVRDQINEHNVAIKKALEE